MAGHRGDLVEDLARVAADALSEATLVVYHSAVLAYVNANVRRAFAAAIHDLGVMWLSDEAPGMVPVAAEGSSRQRCPSATDAGSSHELALR